MSKILCILDGFGLAPKSVNNAAALANMPNFKFLLKNYFWTTLNADGENVGQEAGLVGNSEVGHMNIGGLKLVPQLSYQITKSAQNTFSLDKNIAPDQLFDPKKFLNAKFESAAKKSEALTDDVSKTVHLVGLFSSGQIHSDLRHWAGAIQAAGESGAEKIVMHLISDGRDSDRQSLVETWDFFAKEYESKIKPFESKIFLGSLGGRFYAMDRDSNWERVVRGILPMFDQAECWSCSDFNYRQHISLNQSLIRLLKKYNLNLKQVFGNGSSSFEVYRENNHEWSFFYGDSLDSDIWFDKWNLPKVDMQKLGIKDIIQNSTEFNYKAEIFDENISPSFNLNSENVGISKNDTVWLINFRTDRMKEMSQMLCDINQEFDLKLDILAMNDYCIDHEIYLNNELKVIREKTQNGYHPVFKNQPVIETVAEYISNQDQTQLHIAETEKYNHVTYFMNGGQNKNWEGEDWVVIDSNKVASHAEKPEMKAKEVTDYILENGLGKYDYILVNYANPDMVGHTGDINAATQTMSFLDLQLGRLIKACVEGGHDLIITADHGNVEKVGQYTENDKKLIDTEHNPNFVPMIILSEKTKMSNQQIGAEIIQKAEELLKSNISKPDIDSLNQVFSQVNQVDLDDQSWLTQSQIPEPILPLWYTGLVLLSI